jgi:hypothetical protein
MKTTPNPLPTILGLPANNSGRRVRDAFGLAAAAFLLLDHDRDA